MYRRIQQGVRLAVATFILCGTATGTIVPRLSFEELTDSSDAVVSGTVIRSWPAWDSGHKYIWTHYELSVTASHKGTAPSRVEFAEPGGTLDGVALAIAGTVSYWPGERVVVFLQKMPNGYLRTTGWGQGKYGLDASGRLRGGSALRNVEVVNIGGSLSGATSLETLDGITVGELNRRVAARIRPAQGKGGAQ
jgi:hypothetical protein